VGSPPAPEAKASMRRHSDCARRVPSPHAPVASEPAGAVRESALSAAARESTRPTAATAAARASSPTAEESSEAEEPEPTPTPTPVLL
jgi:hypothetical protein